MNTDFIEFAKNGFELATETILAELETQQVISPMLEDAINFLDFELASCGTCPNHTDVIEAFLEESVSIDAVIKRINLQVDLTEKLSTHWHRDLSSATVIKEKAQDLVEHLPYYDNGLTACLATINLCVEVLQSKEYQPSIILQIGQLNQLYKKAYSTCHTLLDVSEIMEERKRRSQANIDSINPRDYRLDMLNETLNILRKHDKKIEDNQRRIKSAVNKNDVYRTKPLTRQEVTYKLREVYDKKFAIYSDNVTVNFISQLVKQAFAVRDLESTSASF